MACEPVTGADHSARQAPCGTAWNDGGDGFEVGNVRTRGRSPNTAGVGARIRVLARGLPVQSQEITAGGLKLDGQVSQLVQAMATYATNHGGFNPAVATQVPTDPALQSAIASSWHA